MERGVGKVRKALTLLMGNFDPLFFPLPPVLVQERVNTLYLLYFIISI